VEIAFQIQPADIEAVHTALYRPAWGARHWGRYERLRLILAGTALTGFVVLLLKLFARNKLGGDIVGWDTVLIFLATGAFMGWWYGRHKPSIAPTGSPLYRPRTLSLDETGFRINSEGYDSHIEWGQVTNLREAGGCLLIWTRLGDTHIVPLRAFASLKAANSFITRAIELREAIINPLQRMPIERFHYRLTRNDVRAFFSLRRELRGWRNILIYLLLFPCAGVVVAWDEGADDAVWWFGLALGIGGAWLLSKLILNLDRRIAIARYPLPKGEVELQRWGDHVRVIADGHAEHTPYQSIANVIATPEHVFLMTAPYRVVIVPEAAFENEAAMAAFARAIDQGSEESQP
jgi:hypothetical protein